MLVDIALSAKLSNCWKPLRALDTTLIWKRMNRTSRNGVGIVKILEIGQSAAKSYGIYKNATERVQRLNGSWDFLKSLRYSLLLCESKGTNGSWLSSSMRIYTKNFQCVFKKRKTKKKNKKQKTNKILYPYYVYKNEFVSNLIKITKMKGYIYKIVNTKTEDIYIGSTIQELKDRFKSHRSNAKLGKTEKLYECMTTNGIENFFIELLEELDITKCELGVKEREYYKKYKPSLNMKTPNIIKDKKYGRIYRITYNEDETIFYIGSTTKIIENRLSEHRSTSNNGATPLYKFMREKGRDNFDIECLEDDIPIEQLIVSENHWITELDPVLNKNKNLCITEQERDHLKYLKNRDKILKRVTNRRIVKRDEINLQKMEHYYKNSERLAEADKQKRKDLRETKIIPYDQHPNFTEQILTTYTIFDLKIIAKRMGLDRSPKLKDDLIEKILNRQKTL